MLWDVNINPLPHENYPIIQQSDCVLGLFVPPPSGVPKQFFSSHLQYIVRPLKIAVSPFPSPPIFPFPPSSLHLMTRPVGAAVLLMQSHELAASTHPLPLQTSILEALNNTSAALSRFFFCHDVKVKLCKQINKSKTTESRLDRDKMYLV